MNTERQTLIAIVALEVATVLFIAMFTLLTFEPLAVLSAFSAVIGGMLAVVSLVLHRH
jgi:hypothetical protein